jgi:hypothetical protein
MTIVFVALMAVVAVAPLPAVASELRRRDR